MLLPEISAEDYLKVRSQPEAPMLLDVREPWEFATSAIPGATLIPMGEIASRAHTELDPDQPIVVLCHHGARSLSVTMWLRREGFDHAQSLAGGIDEWSRKIDPNHSAVLSVVCTASHPSPRRALAGRNQSASAWKEGEPMTRSEVLQSTGVEARLSGLAPIRADEDSIVRITTCTRPFRPQGPRIEVERVGDKLIVHNYGHGGSGWSLSWGSGTLALDLAFAGRDPSRTDVGVIGCGALGLTSAILAQRAGARSVTIYAKDLPSESRSFRATGAWTPDSRIALERDAPAAFGTQWEQMARCSWRLFQSYLHSPGNPVEFNDRYALSDLHPDAAEQQKHDEDSIGFARLAERIRDLNPHFQDLSAGMHPFSTKWARHRRDMMFNITSYVQQLTEQFQQSGGTIVTHEFHAPSELAKLPQPVILHSTGYAARSLFGDETLIPVKGQIGWLIAQPEVDYGLYYGNLNVLSRADGIVVQMNPKGEASGWKDASEEPDPAEAADGLHILRNLYKRMKL